MKVIFVMSGKGGVGKTTISVNLASALNEGTNKVGLMDADIHGPNIPNLLGVSGNVQMKDNYMYPLESEGLKIMSIGFMLGDNDSVAWRGPMKHNLIRQFVEQTRWGELDYLVVDLPPGTGDEAMSVIQLLKENENAAVIVSTPQRVSIQDSTRCIDFARKMGINIAGIVENMSGGVLGEDTLKEVADSGEISFLGKLSLDEKVVDSGEKGEIFSRNEGKISGEFSSIARNIKDYLG